MIAEIVFSILCVIVSIRNKNIRDGYLVLLVVAACEMFYRLDINDFIYHTTMISNYCIFIRFIESKIIKLSLIFLVIFEIIRFAISVTYLINESETTWNIGLQWFGLYDYLYYSTLCSILLGLSMGGNGGGRVNSASNNLFSPDYNSVNYQRVRSKFN